MIDAFQNHVFRTQIKQCVNHVIYFGIAQITPRICALRQYGRFRQIRHQHVGAIHQRAHSFAEFRRVCGVDFAAVSHYRIHQT